MKFKKVELDDGTWYYENNSGGRGFTLAAIMFMAILLGGCLAVGTAPDDDPLPPLPSSCPGEWYCD